MTAPSEKFWESAYSRNIDKLIGICYRYTGNRQLSEDLAHDAFLKAINRSDGFKGTGNFDAWLRRIVVNHALQYIRDQKSRRHVDEWLQHESHVEHPDVGATHDISERSDFSEKELLDVINDLPEHHRLVFNLYVIDRFTHIQIGEELGISSGTSKSHLARARKKIKEVLVEKASGRNEERARRRGWLFFLFPWSIDKLIRKEFNAFGIGRTKNFPIDLSGISNVPTFTQAIAWSGYMIAATFTAVTVVAVVVMNSLPQKADVNISAAGLSQPDTLITNNSDSQDKKTADQKNNSSAAATFAADSVILKKTTSMKKLDSLGAMLLLSSAIVFDSTAQSNVATTEAKPLKEVSGTQSTTAPQTAGVERIKSKEEGTFSASSLFWSGKDNVLYFKGRVRVDFQDQNFDANGEVDFLGPVYFLIVNGKPVTINSTVELTRKKYRIARLSSVEAMEKYGDKGRKGAVEIENLE